MQYAVAIAAKAEKEFPGLRTLDGGMYDNDERLAAPLPEKAREAVVDKMLSDKEFREDLLDAAVVEQRRKEPSRPLDQYLSDRRKKG